MVDLVIMFETFINLKPVTLEKMAFLQDENESGYVTCKASPPKKMSNSRENLLTYVNINRQPSYKKCLTRDNRRDKI